MTQVSPEVTTHFQDDTLPKRYDVFVDSAETDSEEVITESHLVFGYDEAMKLPELSLPEQPEGFEEAVQAELATLDGWLAMRVRNELVVQMYQGAGQPNWKLDTDKLQRIIENELAAEKAKQQADVTRMAMAASVAATRLAPDLTDPTYFWVKDVDNLAAREAAYEEVVNRIEAIESNGNDGFIDLTEQYIQRMYKDASTEALAIFAAQKKALEEKMDIVAEQLVDRDLQLLDQSLSEPMSLQDVADAARFAA